MRKDKSTMALVIVVAITTIVAFLGDEPSYAQGDIPVLQGWIGAALSAITSIGGGIASAITANKQAERAKAESDKAEALLQDWYDREMGTNILDRADTLSMLKQYRDAMDEQGKKYQTNAIKGGASEEAKIAYAQAQNKGYADAISKIAAQGQQRKDQVTDAYMQGMRDIHNQRAEQYLNSGQQMANIVSSLGNGLSSAVGGMDWGGGNKAQADILPQVSAPTSTTKKINGA
jgi:hypothetical protein